MVSAVHVVESALIIHAFYFSENLFFRPVTIKKPVASALHVMQSNDAEHSDNMTILPLFAVKTT